MRENLIRYFAGFHQLPPEIAEAASRYFEYRQLPKNNFLLRQGQRPNYLYFVEKGLIRVFSEVEGKEVSVWFGSENSLVVALNSFLERKASQESIHLLEDSSLYAIHYARLQALYDRYPAVNRIGRLVTERYAMQLREHVFSLRHHSTQERYEYFLEKQPDLLQRVPLKYIASFLGMTIQALSMARAKLR